MYAIRSYYGVAFAAVATVGLGREPVDAALALERGQQTAQGLGGHAQRQ